MNDRRREPKGIPAGGEFAKEAGAAPNAETCPRRPPFAIHGSGRTVPAPIMAIMPAADAAPPSHSSTAGMSYRIRSAFFPKRKFYGQANRACITCNTYSVPYKGKPSKKRLSPKWVNTLIHSYVTFYKTFIFQYLSLWKSVFSPN